ncbi:salivary endonuclease-like [Choristoneura fumiferana]|uniref:salivary endonuclease-like n=1 Tax=Choristoneura fumiferana TaxID=7141 RepID=UPI003D159B64
MDYDELAYSLQMYSPSVKGRYTCIVSNEFGSAQHEFVVKTFGCALDIKNDFKGNAPLMLTPKLEIPKFEVVDGHVNIPRDEYIVFYCPAGFTILRKREIMVTCVNNKIFDYEGTKLSYSDFKCNHKVDTIPFNTKHRCNHGNSELIDIGFNARKKFVPVYQLCWDGIKTVYSKLNIQPTLANILPNYGFNNGPHSYLNTIFNCNNQNNKITEILGLEFHTRDSCCFEKRQLVSPKDVAPGLSQTATYISLNVVPHWSTCNSQNWDDVEQRIRTLAVTANHELQVWTGVAQDLRLLDTSSTLRNITLNQQVSKYLWKVIQDPASKASLAIIQVNVPDLELREALNYRRCNDVCGQVRWMQSSHWRSVRRGYTYCCSLSDFELAFSYSGEFPPYTKLLKDVD